MCTEVDWDRVWQEDVSGVSGSVHASLEVKNTSASGRGVWAAAPLKAGELLVAERALAVAKEMDLSQVLVKMQADLDPLLLLVAFGVSSRYRVEGSAVPLALVSTEDLTKTTIGPVGLEATELDV